MLRESNKLMKAVFAEQSRNNKALLALIKPLAPNIIFVVILAGTGGFLQGVFHQIKYWTDSVMLASQGHRAKATKMLMVVWAGHLLIKALNLLECTFTDNAQSLLGQRVRNGVLNAMVRQDYEFFDRNSPGILQDRLNRDANELGNNIIKFPARNASRIFFLISNFIELFRNTPATLVIPALMPCVVLSATMTTMFQYFNRLHSRARRVEEESIKSTSEVLREIKTVRQFAMETQEAANYARAGRARHFMVEGHSLLRQILDSGLWSLFDSGESDR